MIPKASDWSFWKPLRPASRLSAGLAGGTGSAVVDGETGLRVDGERVEAIAQGIARLLHDTTEAETMGRNARQRVLANFTHERRVEQLRRLVREKAGLNYSQASL